MKLIDTHTHIYLEAFDSDQKEVMDRAIASGVEHFFIPSINSNYVERMYTLEKNYPDKIHLMAGLHPCYVKENMKDELDKVLFQLEERSFCAIGEIGIDLFWDKTFLKFQQEAFSQQIEWAKNFGLPIVIHCRDAFDEVFEVLDQQKSPELNGIFHCFTGDLKQAKRAIDLNLKLGIGGVITYKNGKIDKFLNELPLKSIVLETDSPYLSPKPYRGKRNESSHLTLILNKVAECYRIPVNKVAAITTQNAADIFKIEKI